MTELQDYATEITIWKEEYLVKIPVENFKTLQNDLSKLETVEHWLTQELTMSPVNPSWYTKRLRQLADKLETKAEN